MTFEIGDIVKIPGEASTYRVVSVRDDGDITVWGGTGGHLGVKATTGHAQFRTFRPEQLRKVKRR